jgi:hypothetical protein
MAHILGGIGHGKTIEEEVAQRTPRPSGSTTTLPEGIDGIPIIVNGQVIGWNIGGEFFTQAEVDALIATGKFPEDGGGGGAGRTQFQSEAALDEAQARLANANAALAELEARGTQPISPFQKAELELDRLRAENDVKTFLLGQVGAERRTLIQEQGAERGRLSELAGRDIFKFTANLRGRTAGTAPTPVDVFKRQGQQFVNQPLPQFDLNASLPQLEAGLNALQKLESPQGQGIFGLAHGGTVTAPGQIAPLEMRRGSDGAFSRTPAIVGEDGPELALLPPGSEIIPLSKLQGMDLSGIPRAQGGLSIPNLNLGGFPDLLDFLRESTGLTNPAFFDTPGITRFDVRAPLERQDAARLGAFQRAPGTVFAGAENFGQPRSGPAYVVDEQGRIRPFTNWDIFIKSGFTPQDIETIPFHQLSRFQGGPAISTEPFSLPTPSFESEFQAFGEPLNTLQGFMELAAINPDFSRADAANLANRIGFLPAPAKIARQIGIGGANLDDQEISGLISLYGLANVDLNTFFRQIEAATPQGRSARPQRIGFTGARF